MAYIEQETVNFGGPAGVLNKILQFLKGTEIEDEVLGTGDGSTLTFSGTLANSPIPRGRLKITYTISSVEYTGGDDCANFIIGDEIDGTVSTFNYDTGAYSITFTTAPDDSIDITASYIYGEPGQDFKLLRYSYMHNNNDTYDTQDVNGIESQALLRVTDDGEVADGVETDFYYTTLVPESAYTDSCIVPFSARLFYTIGGVEYYADSHEIQDRRHGDDDADHNLLIGDSTFTATSGQFFNDSNISSSSISWSSDRGVSVSFNTAPDADTEVLLYFSRTPLNTSASMEIMLQSLGSTGLDEWVFCMGMWTEVVASPTGGYYVVMYYEYNDDPDNVLGLRYDIGVTRNPSNWPELRTWGSDVVLNFYSNQDRVVGAIETQAGYFQTFHCGYMKRPCSPEYYPNPCFVSGDQYDSTLAHNNLTERHTVFFNVERITYGTGKRWFCLPDNVWSCPDTDDRFHSSSKYSGDVDTSEVGYGLDGNMHLFPIHMWMNYSISIPTFLGTLNGVYKVYSADLSAYDLIDDGTYTYRVFPDVARTGWADFWCVRREVE